LLQCDAGGIIAIAIVLGVIVAIFLMRMIDKNLKARRHVPPSLRLPQGRHDRTAENVAIAILF
jgi:uncharacterized membrane-anchored protein YhcB (DUF1043 family)